MSSVPRQRVVVLGAGITGLAAAYRLGKQGDVDVQVIDKEIEVGGVCRSFTEGDFILDYGPHKFYTLLPDIQEELISLMGDELLERDKKQNLYMCGKYFDFPLKMSEMVLKFPPQKSVQVLLSFALQVVKNRWHHKAAVSYEDFIVERFGRGLYSQIFEPLCRKVFGEPALLDRKLAEVRISSPGLIAVIKQILFRSQIDRTISAPTFHYPKYGYGRIAERLKERCERDGVRFNLGSKLLQIDLKGGSVSQVVLENQRGELVRLPCDQLIYTIPLSALGNIIPGELPTEIRQAVSAVSYRNVIIHYYLLRSQPVLPAMWVFYPEAKFRFSRLSEMTKFSPFTAPTGHTSLMVDFTCEPHDQVWAMDDIDLGKMLLQQLQPLNLFRPQQIVKSFSRRFRSFYPVYSIGYQQPLAMIRKLETIFKNIYFVGRVGDFNYNNSDQCLDMGFKAADHILGKNEVRESWQAIRKEKFEQYRIVD